MRQRHTRGMVELHSTRRPKSEYLGSGSAAAALEEVDCKSTIPGESTGARAGVARQRRTPGESTCSRLFPASRGHHRLGVIAASAAGRVQLDHPGGVTGFGRAADPSGNVVTATTARTHLARQRRLGRVDLQSTFYSITTSPPAPGHGNLGRQVECNSTIPGDTVAPRSEDVGRVKGACLLITYPLARLRFGRDGVGAHRIRRHYERWVRRAPREMRWEKPPVISIRSDLSHPNRPGTGCAWANADEDLCFGFALVILDGAILSRSAFSVLRPAKVHTCSSHSSPSAFRIVSPIEDWSPILVLSN
jgi:hypothetical protein